MNPFQARHRTTFVTPIEVKGTTLHIHLTAGCRFPGLSTFDARSRLQSLDFADDRSGWMVTEDCSCKLGSVPGRSDVVLAAEDGGKHWKVISRRVEADHATWHYPRVARRVTIQPSRRTTWW